MSVCDGCPCVSYIMVEGERHYHCGLIKQPDGWFMGEGASTCPYAPILKLLMEAVEVSNEEKMKTTKHVFGEMAIQDLKAKGWERVKFWIRRKP